MIPNLSHHRFLVFLVLTFFTLLSVFVGYAAREYVKQLPPIHQLDHYTPSLITRVYDIHHEVIAELFVERRSIIPLTEAPVDLQRAFLAIEDDRFYSHPGIDIKAIVRALISNIRQKRTVQGASTITQQLAKNIFLTQERTWNRKFKELILTFQIEHHFSKDEILQLYLNQIYFGHGAYGVGSAAKLYFNKPAKELNLAECALIAALPKAPASYSPINHPDRAIKRRNLVLRLMKERGFITEQEELKTVGQTLTLRKKEKAKTGSYFTEAVRIELAPRYGTEAIYREGLSIYTTLDLRLQKAAEAIVEKHMAKFDETFGEQRLWLLIERDEEKLKEFEEKLAWHSVGDELSHPQEEDENGDGEDGLAVSPNPEEDQTPKRRELTEEEREELETKIEETTVSLEHWKEYYEKWKQHQKKLEEELSNEEIEETTASQDDISEEEEEIEWIEPIKAQAALVAIDPKTGGIRAMVGGRNFEESQFNRARQAKRQPGSTFKTFVWLAALESGFTPASIVDDYPIAYTDVTHHPKLIAEATSYALLKEMVTGYYLPDAEPDAPDPVWAPQSWDHKYYGPITLRRGLAWSRNLVSVRLTDRAGPKTVIEFARKAGIKGRLDPVLSLGLGASVVTVEEMTNAFATFANGGVYMPVFSVKKIVGHNGRVLEEHVEQGRVAISPQSSYLMTRLMQAVIQEGTGRYASRLKRPVAGKTGTTQDKRDVWFMGYIPDLVAGVWMGHDDFVPLAKKGLTSSRTSVPLWTDFMKEAGKHLPPRDFALPPGIVFENVDADTGFLAMPYCPHTTLEYFRSKDAPTELCPVDHEGEDAFDWTQIEMVE